MKMAKATDDDLRRVRDFFEMIEEYIQHGTYTAGEDDEPEHIDDTQFVELISCMWNHCGPGVGSSWSRVVCGCQMLIDNCCDPSAATLEWRPDIKTAMEAAGVECDD